MGFHIWETLVSEGDFCFLLALIVHELGMTNFGAAGFSGRRRFLRRTMALRPSCAMQANIGQQSLQSEAMRNTKIAT